MVPFIARTYRALRNWSRYGSSDFFSFVSIETTTYCNRRCWYCPNSIFERGLLENKKLLPATLFYKIVDELAELKFKGIFAPNLYGEPLLDERLIDFVAYARRKNPLIAIYIFTNGDYLTVDYYKNLVQAGVSVFIITRHSDEVSATVTQVLQYRQEHGHDGVQLAFEKLSIICNRGGLIRQGTVSSPRDCRVLIPEIAVDYQGNVILCCQDYFSSVTFGNVGTEKLIDIWKKPAYKRLRRKLQKGVFEPEICKKCMGIAR